MYGISNHLPNSIIDGLKNMDSRITDEMSVKEMMKIVDEKMKMPFTSKDSEREINGLVGKIIMILREREKIKYNTSLELKINDPTVAEIYEKLGKKLVGGRRRRKTCRRKRSNKRSNRRR